ncbi:HEAT repeat domain-containing protein [Gimesia panareensis]|uniref:Uncharacterized protein n=1 Tax=Gimesia panareensis TaxID=2527978 RepID=A0A517QB84_9PLAN|nr:hypothetical protein [Gimesia panareensis]QDT28891.1 hypothetical protein Enr10x_42370 [Gimesia panareensis]QDU51738.1 hypothetical protein Pan110_41050 [Gimesia panareensis]
MKQLALSTFVLFCLLPPRAAEACMGCVNGVTEVQLPFLNDLLLLFAGWLVLTLIFSRPLTRGTRRFFYFGIPFFILGVLMIVPLALGLPILLCWFVYVLFQILQFFSTRQERILKNLLPLGINVIAILLAVTLIFVNSVRASSTPGIIKTLGGISPFYPQVVHRQMERLIERGPDVVPPLATALVQGLDRDYISSFRIAQIAYCLSQIDDPQAEATLQDIIEYRMTFQDNSHAKWEAAVCCLYAECAGKRAVPVLRGLLVQGEASQNRYQKFIALIALARTGDPHAVSTVLDHIDFLQEGLNQNYETWDNKMTHVTLQALAEGQHPADLIASPVYDSLRLGLQPDSTNQSGIEWNEYWNQKIDPTTLKQHWATLLKEKS